MPTVCIVCSCVALTGVLVHVSQTEEAEALERHLQETREQFFAARRDCERGRAEVKSLKAELQSAQVRRRHGSWHFACSCPQ